MWIWEEPWLQLAQDSVVHCVQIPDRGHKEEKARLFYWDPVTGHETKEKYEETKEKYGKFYLKRRNFFLVFGQLNSASSVLGRWWSLLLRDVRNLVKQQPW